MNDNGRTNYSVSLDTSELEASAKKVINTFKTMGNDIEKEGKRIDNAFDIRLLDDIFCNHTSLVFSEDTSGNKKGEGQLLRCLRLRKRV